LLSQYIENFYYGGIGKPAVEIKKNENEKKSEEKNENESREKSALGTDVIISKDNRKNSKVSNSKASLSNVIVDDNRKPMDQKIPARISNVSTFLDLPVDSTYLDLPVNMLTEQQVR
jgi:hypothetical protein